MIGDFLRKSLAWARGFFWVTDDDTPSTKPARGTSTPTSSQRAGTAAPTSTAQRRPAEAKTSTNKRGAAATKRTGAKSGTAGKSAKPSGKAATAKGASAKSGAAKGTGAKATGAKATGGKATGAKGTAAKGAGSKSLGPGAPHADPAAPGDLSEIKGIGPAMKTKLAGLGIQTFADLAGADANQVAKSLNQRTITPERVRGWIAEAKKRS